jgi:hypothetical protein
MHARNGYEKQMRTFNETFKYASSESKRVDCHICVLSWGLAVEEKSTKCEKCQSSVHEYCWGEGIDRKISEDSHWRLLCYQCEYGDEDAACFICHRKEGMMKVLQTDAESIEYLMKWYHPLCAFASNKVGWNLGANN